MQNRKNRQNSLSFEKYKKQKMKILERERSAILPVLPVPPLSVASASLPWREAKKRFILSGGFYWHSVVGVTAQGQRWIDNFTPSLGGFREWMTPH